MKIRLLGFILMLFFGFTARAQYLDPTFGTDGKITITAENYSEILNSLTIQKDGRIVTVGSLKTGSKLNYMIKRYMSNGDLDKSFSYDGILTGALGDSIDVLNMVDLQDDGKIIVGGYSFNDISLNFILMRFLPNGFLDNSFGVNGNIIINFGLGHSEINTFKIQEDGKIIVGGALGNSSYKHLAFARYLIDGTLDTTFGQGGVSIIPISKASDWVNALTVQVDGKILFTGGAYINSKSDLIIGRVNSNGNLDKNFGENGFTSVYIGLDGKGTSIVLEKDEKIVIGGVSLNLHLNPTNGVETYDADFSIVRFDKNGILDLSFNGNGKVQPYDYFHSTGYLNTVIIQSDGKMIAGCSYYDWSENSRAFLMVRFSNDGLVDKSFGKNGFYSISPFQVYSIKKLIDGKIIVGGNSYNPNQNYISLMRIVSDDLQNVQYPIIVENKFLFYPNPSRGYLTIELNLDLGNEISLDILSMRGQLLKRINQLNPISMNKIDLSEFTNGLYCFKLYSDKTLIGSCKILLSQ